MKQDNILGYILIIFVLGMTLKVYLDSDAFNLKCIISEVDGNSYCVRERNKINLVADLLAHVTTDLKHLVQHMSEKYPDRSNTKLLVQNFNPQTVKEILPTSKYTAYSENKGEKLAFCVTKKKQGNNIIDRNTLTFVAIHELAHICTKSIGHKDEFWGNFKFLLENAKEINIYNPEDYKRKPKEYCGMKITDNPYYDL